MRYFAIKIIQVLLNKTIAQNIVVRKAYAAMVLNLKKVAEYETIIGAVEIDKLVFQLWFHEQHISYLIFFYISDWNIKFWLSKWIFN